jgi:hypothetical protein
MLDLIISHILETSMQCLTESYSELELVEN